MIIKGNTVGYPLPDPRKGLSMEGGINMNGQKLNGISAPVDDDDAVNFKALKDTANQLKALRFRNVAVAAAKFVADESYGDYPLRAAVALEGVLENMVPDVVFALTDAVGGNFAPVADSYNGGIYLYAAEAPEADVTIPVITCWKGDA